jgi:hypothetical protein
MPNVSTQKSQDPTSSGHGALGMGGDPTDDPRDLKGGGGDALNEDRGGGTGPIPGASGSKSRDVSAGSVAGVPGDQAVTEDLKGQGPNPGS